MPLSQKVVSSWMEVTATQKLYWDHYWDFHPHDSVGASPMDVNQEEKDLLDLRSANSTKETSPLVQLSPGGGNPKELPEKTNFMGGQGVCSEQ